MLAFKKQGEDLFVSESAVIKNPQEITLGDHVAIDVGVFISTKATIGDYVHIAPYSCIIGGVGSNLVMKHFSGISAGCKIICGSDDFTKGLMNPQVPIKYRSPKFTTVTFEKHACVGVNCVVMPGVTLGEGSVVGAGSVVTQDTEPWTIYVGSPAKPIKARDKKVALDAATELGYEQ
jgi:acetyltransferase-like isoleucine patch superfamily enzyme